MLATVVMGGPILSMMFIDTCLHRDSYSRVDLPQLLPTPLHQLCKSRESWSGWELPPPWCSTLHKATFPHIWPRCLAWRDKCTRYPRKSSLNATYVNQVTDPFVNRNWKEWSPYIRLLHWTRLSQIAKFMGPTWGPPGSCRPQMGLTLAPWTLLSGLDWMAALAGIPQAVHPLGGDI